MDNARLLEIIIELEARVCAAENIMDAIVELNHLKVPSQNEMTAELNSQRKIAAKKYS